MISKKNILELQARRKIYQFILKNSGLHLREISRKINIPKTTLKYHLEYLEKQSLVTTNADGGYRRYYVTNKLGRKEKEILNLLRQEVPGSILLYMTFFIVCSQIELSKALEKHPSTIAFHLKKLKDLNIIKTGWTKKSKINMKKPIGIKRKINPNEKIYYLNGVENYYIIHNLLIKCKNILPDQDFIDTLLKFANELTYLDKSKKLILLRNWLPYKKINNPDNLVDLLIEMGYEVFPHPYHA